MVPDVLSSDVSDPRELEEKGEKEVPDKKIEETWKIVTNVEDLVKPIQELEKKGFNFIQVHSSSPNEHEFITQFGRKALPHLKKKQEMATAVSRT